MAFKKYFNTAGPCLPEYHYMVDAVRRLGDVDVLVEQMQFFVLHAPRQSGKTTSLREWAKRVTDQGRYAAVHFSCETGEVAGDDFELATTGILAELRTAAARSLPADCQPPAVWPTSAPNLLLTAGLGAWAACSARPLVLCFDEIDALRGESLRSVLRQLRSGFSNRPRGFPSSVVLCGLRDVRDYKAAAGGDADRLGSSSPFNIKVKSLTLETFQRCDVEELFAQHTTQTGQVFTSEAIDLAMAVTGGQPWLVNALAREVVEEMRVPQHTAVVWEHIEMAKERLILARATHLDSLVARLLEPRVRRIVEPLLSGELAPPNDSFDDDLTYAQDLGLLTREPVPKIANPIYKEVIVRVLSREAEARVVTDPRTFVRADGTLDMERMLHEFSLFWKEQGAALSGNMPYQEVAHQLVMMAYLQRVVNGGGYIAREYGMGWKRMDLLVRWPFSDSLGKRHWQVEAMELKVWRDGRPDPMTEGLKQLDGYLQQASLDHGYLVLFDRRSSARPVEQRVLFERHTTPSGRPVLVMRA